jgi:hypothetical protein
MKHSKLTDLVNCDLCHLGELWIDDGNLYFIICWKFCALVICGNFCFMFLKSISKQFFYVSLINWIDCHKSYMTNKYGLYIVNGENNVFIQNFKYSCIENSTHLTTFHLLKHISRVINPIII